MNTDMASKNITDYFRAPILIAIACLAVFLIWKNTLADLTLLKWNSWAFYEWLINYEGGFVRRGLIGDLITRHFYGNEFFAVNLVVFILSSILVILATIFALTNLTTAKSALLFAFCPTGLYWMAVGNQYYYRKEILFYISILLACLIFRKWLSKPSKALGNFLTATIFTMSFVLPLIHESFLFYGCFIFCLVLVVLHRKHSTRAKIIVGSYLAVSLSLFALLSVFKGDATTSEAIWGSISETTKLVTNSKDISGGISAIGWSLSKGLSLPLIAIQSGLGTYYLFPILVIYLTVGFIVSEQRDLRLKELYFSKQLFLPFLLITLSFLPLFILGWDWGRWVMGIWYVSICAYLLKLDTLILELTAKVLNIHRLRLTLIIFPGLLFVGFITRVPECCFSDSDTSLPLNLAFSQFKQILKQLFASL